MRSAVFLPTPGIAWKRAVSWSTIARRRSAAGEPETIASATFGPDPRHRQQMEEELALGRVGEAVELKRVLADVQVRLDDDLAPALGRPHSARGRREQVADAVHVEHEAVGRPPGERAAQPRRSSGDPQERRRERVADRDREGVGGVVRGRVRLQREDGAHHPLHLGLLGAAVAADGLLHPGGRVLSALDADHRGGDEHRPARLPDGERGAGICADEGLFQRDGVRRVLRNELLHPLEDRLEAELRALPRGCLPPPVVECPDTASAFLDDPVPACSRPWIDAENLHEERLGGGSDVPSPALSLVFDGQER